MVFVYGAHAVFGMYRNLEVRIMQIMDIVDLDLWVLDIRSYCFNGIMKMWI